MPTAGTGLSRHAEGVSIRILSTLGSLFLIENALGRILKHLLLANVEQPLQRLRQWCEVLSRLARDRCNSRRGVLEDGRANVVAVRRPICWNGDLAGIPGIFDDLPPSGHNLCREGWQEQENQSGDYAFSHAWSLAPAEVQDKPFS